MPVLVIRRFGRFSAAPRARGGRPLGADPRRPQRRRAAAALTALRASSVIRDRAVVMPWPCCAPLLSARHFPATDVDIRIAGRFDETARAQRHSPWVAIREDVTRMSAPSASSSESRVGQFITDTSNWCPTRGIRARSSTTAGRSSGPRNNLPTWRPTPIHLGVSRTRITFRRRSSISCADRGRGALQATRDRRVARYLGEHGFTVREIRITNASNSRPLSTDDWQERPTTRGISLSPERPGSSTSMTASSKRRAICGRSRNASDTSMSADPVQLRRMGGRPKQQGLREDARGGVSVSCGRRFTPRAHLRHPLCVVRVVLSRGEHLPERLGQPRADFLDMCADLNSVPIVMQPLETWRVGEPHDNAPAIRFWDRA